MGVQLRERVGAHADDQALALLRGLPAGWAGEEGTGGIKKRSGLLFALSMQLQLVNWGGQKHAVWN